MQRNYAVYKQRRDLLVSTIKKAYASGQDQRGLLILFAGFEQEKYRFRQDSTFYYYTGFEDPALALVIDLEGPTVVFMPQYGESRTKWVSSKVDNATQQQLESWGIDKREFLGNPCKSYTMAPACTPAEYENIIKLLKHALEQHKTIFTVYPEDKFVQEAFIIDRLSQVIPSLRESIKDISPLVAAMRRTKSQSELEEIYKAVDCTMAAHEAAAPLIEPDKFEYEIQAPIEFIFTQSGGSAAFPSIVASGANATILHYTANNNVIKKEDLVIVDIGAEINYYCGDLTRTYPASGHFSKRQREVYNLVLETQEYIESIAQPGYWLSNKNQQDKSLHHLAYKFLESRGYAQYFTHGIGHFLGMDVHDVGDYTQPLKEGDVITIEPGIYIPQEKLGVRIEDNYWIGNNSAVCLSQELPKNSYEIEEMMAQQMDDFEE